MAVEMLEEAGLKIVMLEDIKNQQNF